MAATWTIHQAAAVVDTAYHMAGATAVFSANKFERRFRDMHAIEQQIQARDTHYEDAGKAILSGDLGTAADGAMRQRGEEATAMQSQSQHSALRSRCSAGLSEPCRRSVTSTCSSAATADLRQPPNPPRALARRNEALKRRQPSYADACGRDKRQHASGSTR